MTRSDRRLHPLSVFFGLGAQLRQFALPALAFFITAGSTGLGWEVWLIIPVAISTLFAVVKFLTFRYRYESDHIVITDGLLFRNERHIPYARIQNIDAVQTVVHRLVGVAEVRIETGGGQKPEATLDVLPMEALAEMRERVFGANAASPAEEVAPRLDQRLLALDIKELVIFGLIHNRGMIVVGTIFGVLWELGVMDRVNDAVIGSNVTGRGMMRSLVRGALSAGGIPIEQMALAIMALSGFLILVRIFSIGWALVRLYGFTLIRTGDDLRMSFGLLTQVSATLPLHRIQTVSIRENVLHRWFERVTVRVETAGGHEGGNAPPQREWLAPVIKRDELPALLRHILPSVDLSQMEWQPPGPRAFRRVMTRWAVIAAMATAVGSRVLGIWSLALFPLFIAWGIVAARKYVAHLRWATGDGVVVLRSGWLSRQTSTARFAKIQAVALHESPFDRRHRHATVHVDTAGATDGSHRVSIPFMTRDAAAHLRTFLAAEAERTAFEW